MTGRAERAVEGFNNKKITDHKNKVQPWVEEDDAGKRYFTKHELGRRRTMAQHKHTQTRIMMKML